MVWYVKERTCNKSRNARTWSRGNPISVILVTIVSGNEEAGAGLKQKHKSQQQVIRSKWHNAYAGAEACGAEAGAGATAAGAEGCEGGAVAGLACGAGAGYNHKAALEQVHVCAQQCRVTTYSNGLCARLARHDHDEVSLLDVQFAQDLRIVENLSAEDELQTFGIIFLAFVCFELLLELKYLRAPEA
jgi:hypothetical protein